MRLEGFYNKIIIFARSLPLVEWGASLLILLTFDVVWCILTSFRAFSFTATYLYALLFSLIFTLPSILVPRHRWIQVLVWILLEILFVANILYFRTYYTAIPAGSYLMVGNLTDFTASVTDSFAMIDFSLAASALLAILILYRNPLRQCNKLHSLYVGIVLVALCFLIDINKGGMVRHIKYLSQQCYYSNCPTAIYTPFGKIMADIMTASEPLSEADKSFVEEWLKKHDEENNYRYKDGKLPQNIVFIFLESFESWPIGLAIENKEVTPNLNKLIADSSTFYAPHVLTQVGPGRSIDSQLINLTGLLPMQGEVYVGSHTGNLYPSIIKAFKEKHTNSKAILLTGDKATVWNQALVAEAFGVDSILDASAWKMIDKIGNPPKLSDGSLFSQIVEKCQSEDLLSSEIPQFIQIVAYSSHNPFIIPPDKRKLNLSGSYPDKYRDYLEAIAYVDDSLGQLISYLQSRSDYSQTAIVIIGDHEGLAYYRSSFIDDKRTGGHVENAPFTPLIVVNSPKGGVYDRLMGQIDVYPTLLDLFGLNSYNWRGLGISLFNPRFNGVAINPNGSLVGESSSLDSPSSNQLKGQPKVSDLIIRHDMLNPAK